MYRPNQPDRRRILHSRYRGVYPLQTRTLCPTSCQLTQLHRTKRTSFERYKLRRDKKVSWIKIVRRTFGRPICVGDLREVMASVSATTSFTSMLFILSSLPISLYSIKGQGENQFDTRESDGFETRTRSLRSGRCEFRSYPPCPQLQ